MFGGGDGRLDMTRDALGILQVNTSEIFGGAQRVSWTLFKGYQARGHASWMAVGRKESDDPNVFLIPNKRREKPWAQDARRVYDRTEGLARRNRVFGKFRKWAFAASQGRAVFERTLGMEDFDYPASRHLLELAPERPDILHFHNMHGAYFDLRILPKFSHTLPTVLTLHDTWLLTGHCAHPFTCERWKTGCGHCPDLTIQPAIPRDMTAYNWRRKARIYAASQLFVATPSKKLMSLVEQSNLNAGIVEKRVIPYGINLNVFRPGNKAEARAALGLENDVPIVLISAHGIRYNPWKDWKTVRQVAETLAARHPERRLVILNVGEKWKSEYWGAVEIRSVGLFHEPETVASFYRAADVLIHPALSDTFPNVILEAMACGLVPIASHVGGIPEQIVDGVTGMLVPTRDADALVFNIEELLANRARRERMGQAGVDRALNHYDLNQQIEAYLDYYNSVLARFQQNSKERSGNRNV